MTNKKSFQDKYNQLWPFKAASTVSALSAN
jgi:hypothetical protein